MSTLPATGYFSDAARTEGQMKTALEDQRNVIEQGPGGIVESTLTIASGSVTPTRFSHKVDTEGAGSTDDLTNIVQTNLPDGSLLLIRPVAAARVTTVKHSAGGAGQISLRAGVDFVLDDPSTFLLLRRSGTLWEEVAHFSKADDRIPVLTKTSAYTVVAQDIGRLIDATTGTWTLSLTAAAALGAGFWFAVKVGTGTITIDPNSSEQIDGATTLALASGETALIICTGTAFRVIGRTSTSTARLLDADTSEAEVVNTTTETTVYTKTIPAGTLGTTRGLRVKLLGDILNNTGGAVQLTVRVKLGATTVLTYNPSIAAGASRIGHLLEIFIAAAGATNAQRAAGEVHITSAVTGSMGGATATLVGVHNNVAEDTTADKDLVITFQWASASAQASAKCFSVHTELLG